MTSRIRLDSSNKSINACFLDVLFVYFVLGVRMYLTCHLHLHRHRQGSRRLLLSPPSPRCRSPLQTSCSPHRVQPLSSQAPNVSQQTGSRLGQLEGLYSFASLGWGRELNDSFNLNRPRHVIGSDLQIVKVAIYIYFFVISFCY